MFKPLTYTLLAVLLAGCTTVGPDFQAPAAPQDAGFRHASANDSASLPAAWWTVFGDATLDSLEQRALRDNPGVHAAAQRLLQAQAQLGVVRAGQAPNVSVNAGVSNARTSAETSQGLALGGRSVEGNNFSVGAALSYELDLWGRVRRVVEAADAQALAARNDRDGVLLLLSSQVATSYWQLRGLDAELAVLRGALDARTEAQQLIEARFKAGLSNERDVSRARVERANAEADLHEVQRQRKLVEHGLATLVGASPSGMLVAARAEALPQAPALPPGLPARLVAQRPDLAASVAQLRALNAQVGVAEGAFYPALTLTGNLGFASEHLRDLAGGGARQFSVGPLALTLPVFDAGRNRANLALSKARYDEALAKHQGKLLGALREVEDALSDLEQRHKQGQAQALSQQAARRALEVAQARYERGVSTYLDVIDAQRSALAAQRAATRIGTQRLLATVALARAIGGGWEQGPALATVR